VHGLGRHLLLHLRFDGALLLAVLFLRTRSTKEGNSEEGQ